MVGRAEGQGVSSSESAREQVPVDRLYRRLDQLRSRTAEQLTQVRRSRASGSAQNRSERDAFATLYEERLARLHSVEDRLCFGRLDLRGGDVRYIGRIGLSDDEQRQLLVDWRAPAAQDFYRATAAAPGEVVRRRHIAIRDRRVVSVEDEVFDLGYAAADRNLVLNGEGALMAALGEHRTGRMRDIVSTIQAEQDRVIRSPLPGVLVVQGGPGTGKTAVALHRAAYLLYTHRDRIARSGVLVVGPSPVFLRYIEQVLPSLGETGVVMATPGQLFPGVEATGVEDPRTAAIKGDLRMAKALQRAVAARQRVPEAPRRLAVDDTTLALHPKAVERARGRARGSRKPHNAAREQFVREVLHDLVLQLAHAQGLELDEDSRLDLLGALRDSPDVRREVNLCWMPLTPQRLLADLWADPARLAAAAPHLSDADRALLRRRHDVPWTPADVPLLDEAAELLGADPSAARVEQRRRAAERAAEVRYAQGALEISGGAGGLVSAELLVDRFADEGPYLTVAERAAADRSWAYGHVVVDEAQELSAMAWRMLMRRCPSRSMTVVGDTAQTGSLAGSSCWGQVLDRYVAGRWRLEELTINYRTPAEIMALAARVLSAAGVPARPPRPARSGAAPVAVPVEGLDGDAIERVVRDELVPLGEGRLAVITPRAGFSALGAELAARLPSGTVSAGPGDLTAPVVVLDVEQVKGLEFDVVVLIEPAAVLAQSPRGAHDLYVALTRPTQRLRIVHAEPLPEGMGRLGEQAA
jgi:DNA helicase IV